MVVFIFFVIVLFGVLLTIFSCVSIIESVAIFDGVPPTRVQWATVDTGPTGYPAREREDLVQLGFFPCNLSSRTIK